VDIAPTLPSLLQTTGLIKVKLVAKELHHSCCNIGTHQGDSQVSKRKFFLEGEEPTEDKNGVTRESFPCPWNEVGYQLIKYISCEGRYSVVYGYHFGILEELRFRAEAPPHQRLNIPYFLLQSLIDSSIKMEGNS